MSTLASPMLAFIIEQAEVQPSRLDSLGARDCRHQLFEPSNGPVVSHVKLRLN